MESNVDTLVYQLEDDDPVVRCQTLQRLRKIAAVERVHFPVRNPRRFLHCVRRRILDDEPRIALEALRLVIDITPALGDDVDQILSSILPHLVSSLATHHHDRQHHQSSLMVMKAAESPTRNPIDEDADTTSGDGDSTAAAAAASVVLHEETFQVFRKYVIVSNDLKAVAELLMSTGLAHTSAAVREASVLATVRLLEDRYARKTRGARASAKVSRMDKALFVGLFQALVPVLEDRDENVVVAAEEALAKLHLYWGDGVDEAMVFLSSEDQRTLHAHQEHIDEFLKASSLASSSSSSSFPAHIVSGYDASWTDRPTSSSDAPDACTTPSPTRLAFGFLPYETLNALQTSTSNSNAHWKRRSAAVETLYSALQQTPPAALQRSVGEMDPLFDIIARLLQDADTHLVKRAVQIMRLGFHKIQSHSASGSTDGASPDIIRTSDISGGGDNTHAECSDRASSSSLPSPLSAVAAAVPPSSTAATLYALKMLPHLVETAASFAEDAEMEMQLYALFAQIFQSGLLSVTRTSQTLLGSMQHRRIQVREEALKAWIALLLGTQRVGESVIKVLSHDTLQVLGQLLGDNSARVRAMAIEAVAVLAAATARPDVASLVEESLDDFAVDRANLDGLRRRLRQKQLPVLLDSGAVSFSKGPNHVSTTVRSSQGGSMVAPVTVITSNSTSGSSSATERSLSSASELRMLVSREFASESLTLAHQSRHVPSPTESARESVTGGSSFGSPSAYVKQAASSMPNLAAPVSTTNDSDCSRALLASGGSMSDRSYFLVDSGCNSNSSSSSSSNVSEPVADKLAMLKKKATQLRKSPSTKQVMSTGRIVSSVGVESGRDRKALAFAGENSESSSQRRSVRRGEVGSGNQLTQFHTSPERCADRIGLPDSDTEPIVVSGRRQRRDDAATMTKAPAPAGHKSAHAAVSTSTPAIRLAVPEPLSSPQKIQMLQSSRATNDEDRPIVSKYALAGQSRDSALVEHDDDDGGGDRAELLQYNRQQQPKQQTHALRDHRESPRSYDDRLIPAAAATMLSKTSSPLRTDGSYASTLARNKDNTEVAPVRVYPAAASRKQVSDASEQPLASAFGIDDDTLAAVEDTYVPSGKAAVGRPISLATRKRLEAKAKQEGIGSEGSSVMDAGAVTSSLSAANDSTKPPALQKKVSIASMTRAGAGGGGGSGGSDDKPTRAPGAFGKQEPRYLEVHELRPVANPKQETAKLLDRIRGADWEDTFEALSIVRRLAMHHPACVDDKIHAVTKEVLAQVSNLRSAVSKNALLALESMCSVFQRAMDPEVDAIIAVLIKRSADSNAFVCESATSAINAVILHCSASKVVTALAPHLSSKAVPLRREVARAMHTLVVSMADSVQSSRDLPAILAIVGKCLEDSNNEVRDAAKQSILYLYYEQHVDGERLKKLVPASARAKAEQVLSGNARYAPAAIKAPVVATTATKMAYAATAAAGSAIAATPAQSGKVNLSIEAPAPKSTSTTSATGAGIRSGLSSSSGSAASAGSGTSVIRKAPGTTAVDTSALEVLQKRLESSNWKDRFDALQETTMFVCSSGVARALAESGKITMLFDAILKRMDDGNAKVNVSALECLEKMVPVFGNGLELVLSSFVPALAKNLAASNPKLASLSLEVVRLVCDHVDVRLLCQHFVGVARHANSRAKPLLIDTLDDLAAKRDEKNQYALNRYVLPLALELVKEAKSDVKDATARLLRSLHAALGPAMLSAVYKQSTAQQEKIASILGISSFVKS